MAKNSAAETSLSFCHVELNELLRAAEARWSEPQWRHDLDLWRKRAASAVFAVLGSRKKDGDIDQIELLLSDLSRCGAADFPVGSEALDLARQFATRGWPGVVAALFLAPAWQAKVLPRLKDVPLWLMPLFATYVFTAPRLITVEGQAEAYACLYSAGLDDLLSLLEANRGSAAAQAMLARFRSVEECPIVALDPVINSAVRFKRARIVAALNRQPAEVDPFIMPRVNRPLRMGVIARAIHDTASTLSLVRMVERMPVARFTTTLFVQAQTSSVAERHLNARGAALTTIEGDVNQIAQHIADANLDVAIFLLDGPWLGNPIAELLVRRLAAVQMVHDGSGLPSGLPCADLYTASVAALPSRGEKGVRIAPAGAVGPGEIHMDGQADTWGRATVGMEDASCVFGYVGDLMPITPEIISQWSRILISVPGSRLAIIAPPANGMRVDRFCATLSVQLDAHGVESGRVAVFGDVSFIAPEERKAALGAFDVLLDANPVANGEIGFAAVTAGCPLVTTANEKSSAAALLEAAGVGELVAAHADAYVAKAVQLGNDFGFRKTLSARMLSAAARLSIQYDSFALGEAFAQVIETAFDRIADSRKAFRGETLLITPAAPTNASGVLEEAGMFLELGSTYDAEARLRSLLVATDDHGKVRRRLAAVLARQGQQSEATDLLVTVVEFMPDDASAWIELGLTARQAGKVDLAVQALQTGVRIDPKRAESWQVLADLAREVGNQDLLEEIETVMRELGLELPATIGFEPAVSPLSVL